MLCPIGQSNEKPPLQALAKWGEYVTLIDQLAGGNRFWSEETALQVEDAIAELQEIIRSLEESPECE